MCGEQVWPADTLIYRAGSPPRVRGTVRVLICALRFPGITPACAGNREAAGLQWQDVEDHPRVCGEQRFKKRPQCADHGSPPRVRGTVRLCLSGSGRNRITPACAGNSRVMLTCIILSGDHPRVCGEQVVGCWDG